MPPYVTVILCLLLAILAWSWIAMGPRAAGKPAGARLRHGELPAEDAPGDDPALRRSVQELLQQMEETSRRMNRALDERARQLQQLLADADVKLVQLQKARSAPAGPAPAAPGEDPRFLEIYRLADQGLPLGEVARTTGKPRGEIELILSLRKEARA